MFWSLRENCKREGQYSYCSLKRYSDTKLVEEKRKLPLTSVCPSFLETFSE